MAINSTDIYTAEDRLYKVLNSIQYMSLEQALKTNYNNKVSVKAIQNLVNQGRAFYSKDKEYLLSRPWNKPFKSRIDAYDIVLQYITNIDLANIFVAPNEEENKVVLGFTKESKAYEIYDAYKEKELNEIIEDIETKWVQINEEVECPIDNNLMFIVLIHHESLLLYAPKEVKAPVVFAIKNSEEEQEEFDGRTFSFIDLYNED